jgi:hypothetical protein
MLPASLPRDCQAPLLQNVSLEPRIAAQYIGYRSPAINSQVRLQLDSVMPDFYVRALILLYGCCRSRQRLVFPTIPIQKLSMHLTNELSTIYWISTSSSQSISLRQYVTKRVALGRENKHSSGANLSDQSEGSSRVFLKPQF